MEVVHTSGRKENKIVVAHGHGHLANNALEKADHAEKIDFRVAPSAGRGDMGREPTHPIHLGQQPQPSAPGHGIQAPNAADPQPPAAPPGDSRDRREELLP